MIIQEAASVELAPTARRVLHWDAFRVAFLARSEAVEVQPRTIDVAEISGLGYMRSSSRVRQSWERVWPGTVPQPGWDLVGRARFGSSWEWVLVARLDGSDEAAWLDAPAAIRARTEQHSSLAQDVAAVLELISSAQRRSRSTGVDWAELPFGVTSRIAVRSFLTGAGVCGRVVFAAPRTRGWDTRCESVISALEMDPNSALSNRVYWIQF